MATLFGGWLGDKLRGRVRGAYFLVCGWGALIALPAFVAMLYIAVPYYLGLRVPGRSSSCSSTPGRRTRSWRTSPAPQIRATAFAINILVIHALGDVISPPLIGLIADRSDLRTALLVVSALILVAGVLWNLGARYLDEETRRVTAAEKA